MASLYAHPAAALNHKTNCWLRQGARLQLWKVLCLKQPRFISETVVAPYLAIQYCGNYSSRKQLYHLIELIKYELLLAEALLGSLRPAPSGFVRDGVKVGVQEVTTTGTPIFQTTHIV